MYIEVHETNGEHSELFLLTGKNAGFIGKIAICEIWTCFLTDDGVKYGQMFIWEEGI